MKDEDATQRLLPLGQMKKFRVAKGESDLRGWDVVATDRRKIGKVHDLIVDTTSMKVRYIDIDVDNKILETKTNSHILVPIAGAHLDDDDNRVYLEEISITELAALPPFDHRPITREFETNISSWFQRSSRTSVTAETVSDADRVSQPQGEAIAATTAERDFYEQEQFSDRGFWGKRRSGREDRAYIAPEDDAATAVDPDRDRT